MPLSLYDVTVPAFIRGFANLSKNLAKGRAWADEQKLPHETLTDARLIADMRPLTAQIQRASDTAKAIVPRITGLEAPAMADTEKTFDEMEARIAATVAFLKSVPAEAFEGREAHEVVLKFGKETFPMTARDYVLTFAIPNFYFHVTTAYDIMRAKGVPLGKLDYIGVR
ncbi:MAG TPA: DUF1993 domain-containing protein [Rhizobiaceae bacterium]|nr:DUF1993 domain-containing protein [Rhizobiaceae bacterium]